MELIPLRTLTVLLNYERMISDPRFRGVRLITSSTADPTCVQRVKALNASQFKDEPATIKQRNFNFFESYAEPPNSDAPSTICHVHPDAGPEVHALTFAQREDIYYETRAHDGCFKAIGLYHFFFELCPPEQQLSIQLTNEDPLLVDPHSRTCYEFNVSGPKLHTIASIPALPLVMSTGSRHGEFHCVLGFPCPPNPKDTLVVDMTRRQYGNVGRGLYEKITFWGEWTTLSVRRGRFVRDLSPCGIS